MKEYVWYDSNVDEIYTEFFSMTDVLRTFEHTGMLPEGSISLSLVIENNELLGSVEFPDGLIEFLGEL